MQLLLARPRQRVRGYGAGARNHGRLWRNQERSVEENWIALAEFGVVGAFEEKEGLRWLGLSGDQQ